VKREEVHQVEREPSPIKVRKPLILGRSRSMPRLYHKEDALGGVPWSDRAIYRLQNAAALLATLPV